jgi:hypothetical protein
MAVYKKADCDLLLDKAADLVVGGAKLQAALRTVLDECEKPGRFHSRDAAIQGLRRRFRSEENELLSRAHVRFAAWQRGTVLPAPNAAREPVNARGTVGANVAAIGQSITALGDAGRRLRQACQELGLVFNQASANLRAALSTDIRA